MSGSSTRDWLLDKLMKLRQAMTELRFDYEGQLGLMRLQHTEQLTEARERATRAENSLKDFGEAYRELETRVEELSPEKQFSVLYRDAVGNKLPLAILSVRTCHGETTITVERG